MQSDFSTLLAPISLDNPMGNHLEYEPVFDQIRQARESDEDDLPQGDWAVSEPRQADWHLVQSLSEQALAEQSKDLQLACWFVEATCHQKGLEGLLGSIDFLSEFMTRFWYQCWPSLEEEGLTIRRSKLVRLDRELNQILFTQPMLRQTNTTLAKWRQILAFEHKINSNPESLDALIEQEGDLTMATFDKQAAAFSSIEISQQAARVEQITTLLKSLESRYASLSQDQEGELFTQTRQTLSDLRDYLQRLTQRAIPLPDEALTLTQVLEDSPPQSTEAPVRHSPQAMSRELAISQMLAIAAYFRQSEPSSPVPFLMERAARWANMTLTDWLQEMIEDSSSIREINNVLTGKVD
ncbi:type VI secretion system protein TssA [Cedecea sp. MMO-103]|uniref:type VI secretion system protein TssA n=1 Tax=Cedecea sp. MMO-103 TaxID=3081238 RepID=UPI003018BDEC